MERRIGETQAKVAREDPEIRRLESETDDLYLAGKSEEAMQKTQQIYERIRPKIEETKPGKLRSKLEDASEGSVSLKISTTNIWTKTCRIMS